MLTWSLFELSRTPVRLRCPPPFRAFSRVRADAAAQATEAKVRAEGARVFGDTKHPATREAVDTMDYTLATLKEILRLYSVVPVVTRVAVVRALRQRHPRPRAARADARACAGG
jgi:cytochrome P450